MSSLGEIGSFTLISNGPFICEMQAKYTDGSGHWRFTDNISQKILFSQTCIMTMDQLGVPNGSQVQIYVLIDAGTNRGATEVFTANNQSRLTAGYTIDRMSLNANLQFQGIV
jgi:hypothetical protein